MSKYHFPSSVINICFSLIATTCLVTSLQAQPGAEEMNSKADNLGSGLYPALKETVVSLPDHVIYRPNNITEMAEQKLGVVAWGNGGCSDDGASSRFHLLELASHGYLVIASGGIYSGPGSTPAPEQQNSDGAPLSRTQNTQLTEAIDWALRENEREGSQYFQRIDPEQIALSGFSCGGLQALGVASDPRVSTLVLHNTGIFNDGPSNIPGMNLSKDELLKIHSPVIYILGGESDIAYANGMDDFANIDHVPVAVANLPVGHGGTFYEDNGGSAAQVAMNWLQWQLRGNAAAADYFTGNNCGLCQDEKWTLESKNVE